MKAKTKTKTTTKQPLNRYARGWNRKKNQELIDHYENQTEDEAVAEAEAAFNDPQQTVMLVPHELVPKVNRLLSAHSARKKNSGAVPARSGHRVTRDGNTASMLLS